MLWLVAFCLISAFNLPVQAQPEASAETVKAAYLFNFAKFVNWPESTFSAPDQPIRLCYAGKDALGKALETLLQDKLIDNRSVSPVHISGPGMQLRNCQVLYHSPESNMSAWELLRLVQDYPVLTIGEGEQFIETGGVIGFVDVDRRIRFDVNLPASDRAGLSLSSRLLGIARQVRQH